MKHATLTIWNAEDFTRPEKLAALRVGDEVAFQLKNGKDAAFVVADIADGILTGCLFKGVRDMAMYDGRRWRSTYYVNYPESDARERLNDELLPLLPDELAALLVERTITQTADGEVYTRTDKLWPLSAVEVFGKDAPDWMQRDDTPDRPPAVLCREPSMPEDVPVVCLAALAVCQLQRLFLLCGYVGRRAILRCQPFAWCGPRLSHRHQGQDGGAGGVSHPGGCGEKRRAPAHRHGTPGHEAERQRR